MYINHDKLKKYLFLSPLDFFLLAAIKNCNQEYIQQNISEDDYKRFEKLSLIKYTKAKNKTQPVLERVRIDKKGNQILKDITTNENISSEIEILANWVKEIYSKRSNGLIKNFTAFKRTLQWYSDTTGIKRNKLAVLISLFIGDAYTPDCGMTFQEFKEENKRGFYSNMADNICWSPSDRFARHYKLEESPLEKYREENLEWVEYNWKEKGVYDE